MFQKCKPKQLLQLFLAFSILFNTVGAHARKKDLPVHEPQFEGQTYRGIGWFEYQTEDDLSLEQELNEIIVNGHRPAVEKILQTDDLAAVIEDFDRAITKSQPLLAERFSKLSLEEFNKQLDTDKIGFSIDDKFVAYTNIDNYPAARIVHEKSGVAILFLDEDKVDQDSKWLKRYKSEQHFNAGRSDLNRSYIDQNGKVKHVVGRDLIIVWRRNDTISNIQLFPREKPMTKEWWKSYFRATIQKPTAYHGRVGVLSAGAQAASTVAVASLIAWGANIFGADVAIESPPQIVAAVQAGFALTLGVMTRSFHKWRSRGTPEMKQYKDESVNIAMYLMVKTVSEAGLINTFAVWDPSYAFAAWMNIIQLRISLKHINIPLKQPYNKIPDVLSEKRDDQGWIHIPVPKITRDPDTGMFKVTSWKYPILKQEDYYRQFKYYLPRNSMTMADRIWFTWWMNEYVKGEAEWYMPWISTVALVMAIPASWKYVKNWAHKNYPDSPQTKLIDKEAAKYLDPREALLTGLESVPFVGSKLSMAMDDFLRAVPKWLDATIFKPIDSPEIKNLDLRRPEKPVHSSDCEEKLSEKEKKSA